MKTKRLALIIAATHIVAACGGTDDSADALISRIVEQAGGEGADMSTSDDGEFTLTIEDEGGTAQATLGGDLPSDFPFPLPDEYEVGTSVQFEDEGGTSYTAVIQVSGDAFDATKEMYESWLEDEGFTVDTMEIQGTEGKGAVITGDRDDAHAYIEMSYRDVANDDGGNLIYATFITLTWTPRG